MPDKCRLSAAAEAQVATGSGVAGDADGRGAERDASQPAKRQIGTVASSET